MTDTTWVNRIEYPFRSRFFDTDAGRMHYVDEGAGDPVVLVHGTPTWSFLYRHLIRGLSESQRVVAVDHLGFGLSDKPEGAPYRPEDHARRLAALIEQLGLRNLSLGVHDFGGPIGLAYAIEHPENVRRLVLFNSWMWSLRGDGSTERASRFLGGPIGRFLYKRLNFSPRVLIPALMGNKEKFSKAVHRQYIDVFPRARDRQAPWVFARELIGSSEWYERLWDRRDQIRDKPTLILWGMKDPAFTPAALARWLELFPHAEVVRFSEAGHFVPEEEGDAVVSQVAAFLSDGTIAPAPPPET